ncbi:glycosyltransferase family 4 protein [Luedemannella flava]|uniref:glycosyltransferase family 4 protein n=1 Tax=Luedemannella flava TaxID=349316 RepID=UPI0031D36527
MTPWFPTNELPYRGAFVAAMVEAVAPRCDRVAVYHSDLWTAGMSPRGDRRAQRAMHALAPAAARTHRTAAGVPVTHAPYPIRPGLSFAELGARHDRALRAALGGAPIDAGIVHAHTGIYSGWSALRHMRPDARLFVTEHSTFVDQVLAEPQARVMYEEVLRRATRFFVVGEVPRSMIAAAFPQHADRIAVMPNAIRFDLPRPEPVRQLRRWLFVGHLIERKNVAALIAAFARCRARDDSLTLTIAGTGALYRSLVTQAKELGVADAVEWLGAVPPATALDLLRSHDLLVHPSRLETFGMTLVEAVAAGMPVLATRSGGPQETLAGIESAVGELVDVSAGVDGLVEGYWRLRGRWPDGLDLAEGARQLAERYGYPAVAEAHLRAWHGAPAPVAVS